MRISFLLIFSFVIMTISTTVYALSSVIGEAILKHQIGLFFEKELIEDYEIRNFKFDGLNLKFDIDVENKTVANVIGQISLKDIMLKLNFQLKNINSKWISKFKNIGYFSAKGEFKLTPWAGKVAVRLITEREKIKFIYRKKFVTKKRYLKIINSNISTSTLHKLLNVDLISGQVYLNGELIGNSEKMVGNMNVVINKIDLSGKMIYLNQKILFQGYSKELQGDFKLKIDKKIQRIQFSKIILNKLFEDFEFKTEFKAYGDIALEAKNDLIFFVGKGEKFIFKNKKIDYINNFFQLNIDDELFENLKFNGAVDDSVLTFNLEADNGNFHFVVEDGVFNKIQDMFSFRTTIFEKQNSLALVVYNSGYPLEINFQSDLGKERFQKFFTSSTKKRSDKKFLQEILDLTLY